MLLGLDAADRLGGGPADGAGVIPIQVDGDDFGGDVDGDDESLRQEGVLVRLRASTKNPGEITGYSVGLACHTNRDGGVVWYGGGKLAADLTLPKLRQRWNPQSRTARLSVPRRITA